MSLCYGWASNKFVRFYGICWLIFHIQNPFQLRNRSWRFSRTEALQYYFRGVVGIYRGYWEQAIIRDIQPSAIWHSKVFQGNQISASLIVVNYWADCEVHMISMLSITKVLVGLGIQLIWRFWQPLLKNTSCVVSQCKCAEYEIQRFSCSFPRAINGLQEVFLATPDEVILYRRISVNHTECVDIKVFELSVTAHDDSHYFTYLLGILLHLICCSAKWDELTN